MLHFEGFVREFTVEDGFGTLFVEDLAALDECFLVDSMEGAVSVSDLFSLLVRVFSITECNEVLTCLGAYVLKKLKNNFLRSLGILPKSDIHIHILSSRSIIDCLLDSQSCSVLVNNDLCKVLISVS